MANPAQRPRFLAPGDKLGKFELIRQLAVGGMAELYLARTMGIEGFEKLVVVKRILPQYIDNPSFVNMFLNEARLSATLHHPNITQVYDIGVEEGDYFFSMEYVHGEDLGRLTVTAQENGVPVSLDCALTLVAGLCAGLHYAHEKAGPDGKPLNVVHRDVSPSNVIVSYDGAVKLVDFGIARAGSQPAATQGGLKGKIVYMSPEQCRGKAVLDRRSDVFSIGSILYELTTGQLPFTDETEYGVLNQIVNTDVQPPSKLVPNYSPALEAIVLKALARDPDQRYRSALELQGQIEDFAHDNRLRVSPLVLARLMSTLFPARLEEWDHARAQGAFFVEQHVLRTLIESGKTGDNAAVSAEVAKHATAIPPPEDETTELVALRPMDTSVGPAPVPKRAASAPAENPFSLTQTLAGPGVVIAATTASRQPTPMPVRPSPMPLPAPRPTPMPAPDSPSQMVARPSPMPRTLTPVPGVPGAVPIIERAPQPDAVPSIAPFATGAGTLVSNRSPDDEAVVYGSPASDVTERVRVPTPIPSRDDTAFIRPPKSRLPVILGLGVAVVAAGIAIVVIGMGGASKAQPAADPVKVVEPAKSPADKAAVADEMKPEPVAVEPDPVKVEPTPVKVEPTPTKNEPIPANAEPAFAKTEPVAKSVTKKPARPPAIAKKPSAAKIAPKAEPKKDPGWNAESPFMPVRTDKDKK